VLSAKLGSSYNIVNFSALCCVYPSDVGKMRDVGRSCPSSSLVNCLIRSFIVDASSSVMTL
jgi:hypothetical protein